MNIETTPQPTPMVGLGMPVHNGGRYLQSTLESILAQTYENWRLVICDNASEDDTEAICRAFAERDSRIRYVRNERNLGAHPNYNKSFNLSEGEYFKWVPHDDVLDPDYLAACIGPLLSDPGIVICQSHLLYIDADDAVIGAYDSCLIGSDADSPGRRFASLVLRRHPCYEVMGVFRRSLLIDSMLLENFHGADRSLLAEMALRGRFAQAPQPLLLVRDHLERYTRSHKHPAQRARWHDNSFRGRITLPVWRLYGEYIKMLWRNPMTPGARLSCHLTLVVWWTRNWNAAQMLVDLVSVAIPGFVSWAERFKQRFIAPAPGADEVRRSS